MEYPSLSEISSASVEQCKEWWKLLPQPRTLEERERMKAIQQRLKIPTPVDNWAEAGRTVEGYHRRKAAEAYPPGEEASEVFDLTPRPGSHEEESE
jgi:hypothetical protein